MLLSFLSKPKKLVLAKTKGKINIVRNRRSDLLQLHINRHLFDVEDALADIMMQGNEYIIYYEKDWDEIVSAEFVPGAVSE